MNLYRDGNFVEMYSQSRDYEILNAYITSHAEPRNPPPEATAEPPALALTSEKDELVEETVYREDVNPNGVVLSLDEKNFRETIDKGHVWVKFFAPWYVVWVFASLVPLLSLCRCGHCKKLAPKWTQLAGLMQNKLTLAEVDCEAHGALCKKAGVTGYPMLFYYGGKNAQTEYTGGRNFEQIKAFADKVSGPYVFTSSYHLPPRSFALMWYAVASKSSSLLTLRLVLRSSPFSTSSYIRPPMQPFS